MKKILIIAPHADDEILGCGGTISKYVEKSYKVMVLVMTNANLGSPKIFSKNLIKQIRKECLEANNSLGVQSVKFYDFPALKLNISHISEIASVINKEILKFRPSKVFIPNIDDVHYDHKIVHEASLVAVRPINTIRVKEVLSYETLSETEWGNIQFSPNMYELLNKKHISNKLRAFKKYKSQIKKKFHPRSLEGIKILSKLRGSNISAENAEAFKIIRIIN